MITIDWLEGRQPEQKQAIVDAIVEAFSKHAGVPQDQLWIRFNDVAPGDWAANGKLQA